MLTPGAYEDRQHMQVRLVALRVVAVVVFVLLTMAFWNLQVLQFQAMRERAENNHMRTIELRAPRGVLFDRHGEVLVQNRRAFRIALVREQVGDLDAVLTRLAATTRVDDADLRTTVKRRQGEPAFRPIPLIENASPAQVAAVLAQALELPGIVVEQIPTRTYPADRLAAHLFGYVGEAQKAQLADGLSAGDIVGQAGIESSYNHLLMGQNGNRFVVVNTRGREIKELEHQEPVDGRRLQLTLDADVQRALEAAFHTNGYNGAGMVLDPRTGEVLAATSLPAYDPNDFAVGIKPATWLDLNRDAKTPLNNRLVQGLYAPGSTFKIVMALAALQERLITPETRIFCGGSKVFYGRSFACAKAGGHGLVNVEEALQHSCNVFFYTLGEQMPVDTIHRYAARLGLVGRTGIDLPNERESTIPSQEWKRKRFNDRWYPGETISVAIGQGYVSTTPVALARMIATVANGGRLVTPHLVKAVDEGQGWQPVPTPTPESVEAPAMAWSPQWFEVVRKGLWRAVNDGGSGRAASVAGRDVVGKTGTAQVISLDGAKAAAGRTDRDLRHHGWFVFFAPADAPEVAGVIFAEHGGSSGAATPIARHVLETYFAKKDGLPLPVLAPKVPVTSTGTAVTTPVTATTTRPAATAGGGRR